MAKEAYYFSHDSNAHRDRNIVKMRMDWGWQGYGYYWAIVEYLRDESEYKYPLEDIPQLQFELQIDKIEEFIKDCIEKYGLFNSDEKCFWSESLLRRMKRKEEIIEKRKKAALAKYDKETANAEQVQSKCKANAEQVPPKEINEINEINEIKETNDLSYIPDKHIQTQEFGIFDQLRKIMNQPDLPFTDDRYRKLVQLRGHPQIRADGCVRAAKNFMNDEFWAKQGYDALFNHKDSINRVTNWQSKKAQAAKQSGPQYVKV